MRRCRIIIIGGLFLMMLPQIGRGESHLPLGWRVTSSEHQTRLVFHPPQHLRGADVALRLVAPAEWETIRAAPSEMLGGRKVIRVERKQSVSFFFEEKGEYYILDGRAPSEHFLEVAIACREIVTHLSLPLPTSEQETLQKVFEGGQQCAPHGWQPSQESRQAAWRAWHLERNGRDDLARVWYEAAYAQQEDPSVAAKLALLALKKGNQRIARKWLKRVDPDSRLGAFAELDFLAADNKSLDVTTLYGRFEREWCGALSVRAAYLAGRAAFAMGDDLRGEELFRRTLEHDPAYLPTYRAWLHATTDRGDARRVVIAELITWIHKASPSPATRELEGVLKAAFRKSS